MERAARRLREFAMCQRESRDADTRVIYLKPRLTVKVWPLEMLTLRPAWLVTLGAPV